MLINLAFFLCVFKITQSHGLRAAVHRMERDRDTVREKETMIRTFILLVENKIIKLSINL